MKHLKFAIIALTLLVALIPTFAFSQAERTGPALYYANEAQLFKTFTNYVTTSDDSTGFIEFVIDPVLRDRILLAREVGILAVVTDTAYFALNYIGYNGSIAQGTFRETYTGDSLSHFTTAATYSKYFTIKGPGVNRLPGSSKMKLQVVFANGANDQGFTAGRTAKFYLRIVR